VTAQILDYTQQTKPPTYKVALVRGDTFEHILSVKKTDFDFTGSTVRSHFKQSVNATSILATPTTTISFPALGECLITVSLPFAANTFKPGVYYCDIEITMPGQRRKTLCFIEVQVIADVTA
jgi:hypothetical protein